MLTKADLNLFCSGCTGTTPNLTLSVRATSGGLPTGADLASATIPGFSNGSVASYFTATFASPPTLNAGTMYALVIRPTANPAPGTYALTRSGTSTLGANVYAGGTRVSGATSGTVWSIPLTGGVNTDAGFRTYMDSGFMASGDQISSAKDANPAAGLSTHWTTMSWNATVPANTTLKFQAAASNNPAGPFNFVGPDGTAATFFTTTPANFSQFNGNRYFKYKAFLSTTDSTMTPTVNDVTVCFIDTSPTAAPANISGQVVTADGTPLAGVTLHLSGGAEATAITDSSGSYRFIGVESSSFYTVTPVLANYQFSPANRSFSLLADKTDALFTASPDAIATTNAIDTNEYFVRQQYIDLLGREPDQGGLDFWVGQLNQCGTDAGCLRTRRVDVSVAFFQSREFQESGSFVYKIYLGALGRQLTYGEFSTDRQQVVGGPSLDASKAAFADAFVERAEFALKYRANTTADSFVDALLQTLRDATNVDLSSQRGNLISLYNSGATTKQSRVLVLREVTDNAAFSSAVYNQSFVLMEYFAYLHREQDQNGYDFWLNVLDNTDANNYRGMVCSFLTSVEYQRRFGSVVAQSNASCA
jgi:hypothetical protein